MIAGLTHGGKSPLADVQRVSVPAVEHRWTQPFRWGLLMAFDAGAVWELPEGIGDNSIRASASCVAVPVLHAQDVDIPDDADPNAPIPEATVEVTAVVGVAPRSSAEFDGGLNCPTGRLAVGDAENERVLDVPPGVLRIQVWREPQDFAERVTLVICEQGV